jgi:hypothetical protein
MTDAVLFSKAYAFAAARHTDQRRKGDREEPYINHLVPARRREIMSGAVSLPQAPGVYPSKSRRSGWSSRFIDSAAFRG